MIVWSLYTYEQFIQLPIDRLIFLYKSNHLFLNQARLHGLQSIAMDIIRNKKIVTEGQGDTATGPPI